MPSLTDLLRAHEALAREGTRLAGGLTDLAQRAAVYHHLFEHSGRNHAFPLLAAHGALWAKGYFAFGMRLGGWFSWQYAFAAQRRRRNLLDLHTFADAFRDVNRRVCVETYASYHFTRLHGEHPEAAAIIHPELLEALNRVHAARRAGRELSKSEKRGVFENFFLNEQRLVVGPAIEQAADAFDWPLMKAIALKPRIRFAYFPAGSTLRFRNFADCGERIANGLQAFDVAAAVGWDGVESALRRYAILPDEFFAGSAKRFEQLRTTVLAG